MSAIEDDQIRHIYEQWHEALMRRDLHGMVALYAEHAIMETPAVLAMFPEREEGIVRGRSAIEQLFARNFKALAAEFSELYRTDDPSGPSQTEPDPVLPAAFAQVRNGSIIPAELLLLNPIGFSVTEKIV